MIEREALYQSVWGYAMAHGDRSVDVFVRKLRAKLQRNSPGWEYIHTHFGIGYRFDPESDRQVETLRPRERHRGAGSAERFTGFEQESGRARLTSVHGGPSDSKRDGAARPAAIQ